MSGLAWWTIFPGLHFSEPCLWTKLSGIFPDGALHTPCPVSPGRYYFRIQSIGGSPSFVTDQFGRQEQCQRLTEHPQYNVAVLIRQVLLDSTEPKSVCITYDKERWTYVLGATSEFKANQNCPRGLRACKCSAARTEKHTPRKARE